MTIEQLSESKLKITLPNSELTGYALGENDITPNSPKLKKFIISIIRKAARETGFEAAGSNIMVESVSSEDCLIFFITKFSQNEKKAPPKKLRQSPFKVRACAPSIKKNGCAFFVFSDQNRFMEFLYAVRHEDFSYCALFTMANKYYFKAPAEGRLYSHALEFSNPVCSQLLAIQLAKDGKLICRGENFHKLI